MMPPVIQRPWFVTGDQLTLDEFLRRWEDIPQLKNVELIDGAVYVSSPVSLEHAEFDFLVHLWLGYYAQATPGCQGGSSATWAMLGSAPQPDSYLRILPSHGGQSRDKGELGAGAPELVVEICVTSTEVDFGPKLRLYERAGVREYITVERLPERLVWRILENGIYKAQSPTSDGILKSQVFPGLWLDLAAFLAADGASMLAALSSGIASEEHREFVARLEASKR